MSSRQSQVNWAKTGIERRRHARLPPSAIPNLKAVRIVAGPEATLVNISRSGALVETEARLAPGSQVALRLVTAEAILMLKGLVVYSRTAALGSSKIRFQSAIEFDEEFALVDAETDRNSQNASPSAPSPDSSPDPAAAAEGETLVTLTAQASGSATDLRELFGLNQW